MATLLALLVVLLCGQLAPAWAAAADGEVETGVARPESQVIELLRLQVPAASRQAWLEAERHSWQPWLERQPGCLDRELLWDAQHEEGTLVIRWASREQWKAIPADEVQEVQLRFEQLARRALGLSAGNPFPLLAEAELEPQ